MEDTTNLALKILSLSKWHIKEAHVSENNWVFLSHHFLLGGEFYEHLKRMEIQSTECTAFKMKTAWSKCNFSIFITFVHCKKYKDAILMNI